MPRKSSKRVTSAGRQTPRGSHPGDAPPGGTPSLIVGLGASAGGLAPLQALLSSLPIGRGLAVVVVQPMPARSDAYPLPLIAEKSASQPKRRVSERKATIAPGITLQIGIEPNRIDVITQVSGLSFEQAWPNRKAGDFGGLQAWYIGSADLLKNKLAAGRPQDNVDAAALRKMGFTPSEE